MGDKMNELQTVREDRKEQSKLSNEELFMS